MYLKVIVRRSFPGLTSHYRRLRYRAIHLPRLTYSFSGEDILILDLALQISSRIRYVDVGCAHPIFDNNTYLLYRKDSFGINVDARIELAKKYARYRKRDKFVNRIVTSAKSISHESFFVAKDDPHTSSKDIQWIKQGQSVESRRIQISTLEEIFETNSTFLEIDNLMARSKVCLVLSVDVEGHDLEVLKSNNWSKYLPDLVAVETLNSMDLANSDIAKYLQTKGYVLCAATPLTSIFKKIDYFA
jgi:hypothetical protein